MSFPKSLIGNPGVFKTISPIAPFGGDKGEETMMTRLISVFCFLLISATPVFADQCYWLSSHAEALKAQELLRKGGTVYEYCAPCKDMVARPIVLKRSDIYRDEECRYFGVTVNGTSIDLAYTYVLNNGEYKNLAKLAGCPSDDVPVILPKEKMP